MTLRLLAINDVHLAASPPIGCKPVYTNDIMAMLLEARDYAKANAIDVTVFTGDFFHSKRNVPYWLTHWAIECLADWPGRKLAIVGNHDLSEEGIASIPRQPIGVLFASGVLEWLEDDLVVGDSVRVQFSPANYTDDIDGTATEPPFANPNPVRYLATKQQDVDYLVKVAHGMLAAPGKTYPFAYTSMGLVVRRAPELDLVLYGHPHYDLGLIEVGNTIFASFGSLGRVARTGENRRRRMHLLEVTFHKDVMDFTDVPLHSALPSVELFIEAEKDSAELSDGLARFARSMQALLQLETTSIEDVVAQVSDSDPVAKRRLVQYLERVGM